MKIAVCLSGAPRFHHGGIFRFMQMLTGFDRADFFIRTWKTPQYGATAEQFVHFLKANGLDGDRYRYPVVQVLDDNAENAPQRRRLNLIGAAQYLEVMWWGIVKCHELFEQYVDQTGEQYDLVLRMRTDSPTDRVIDLAQYTNPTRMYAGAHFIPDCAFTDSFLFGSPEMYKKFVGYWPALDYYVQTQEPVHPENSLRDYFIRENIDCEVIEAYVHPVRDQSEYSVRTT